MEDMYIIVRGGENYGYVEEREILQVCSKKVAFERYRDLGYEWYKIENNGYTTCIKSFSRIMGTYYSMEITTYGSDITEFINTQDSLENLQERILENTGITENEYRKNILPQISLCINTGETQHFAITDDEGDILDICIERNEMEEEVEGE